MSILPRPALALPFILSLAFIAVPRLRAQAPYQIANAPASPPSSADSMVLATLGWADRLEVALARAALPSLHDPALKVFAGEMIDEHTADQGAIDAIGTRLGLPPAPEVAPGAELAGTTDSEYVARMVARHEQLLQRLPPDGIGIRDPRLREHLVLTRRALRAHLDQAKALQARLSTAKP